MAVCNLFNELSNASGNFLMFSQYVEDITRNYTDGDNWKVIPTGFVALDVNYDNVIENTEVNPNQPGDDFDGTFDDTKITLDKTKLLFNSNTGFETITYTMVNATESNTEVVVDEGESDIPSGPVRPNIPSIPVGILTLMPSDDWITTVVGLNGTITISVEKNNGIGRYGEIAVKINEDQCGTIVIYQSPDVNALIPKYFQNCFENACAYGRNNEDGFLTTWTPEHSRNLFWNFMRKGGFVTTTPVSPTDVTNKMVPEIVHYGDINMHSYNEHKGMGYGEIYCYIPTDARKLKCGVTLNVGNPLIKQINKTHLEGFAGNDNFVISPYSKTYTYSPDFSLSFEDEDSYTPSYVNTNTYNINTIVVLYSIFTKTNDEWTAQYSNIPLGMYIAGKFNDGVLTNTITKHVASAYDTGTSYGLRICTRLTATSAGNIVNTDIITDDSGYTNMCQLMTAMNENLSKMLEISKHAHNTVQGYKETLSVIKNNRTNVPYIKNINGTYCWFVNGRFVSTVDPNIEIELPECNHDCSSTYEDFDFATPDDVEGVFGIE